MIRVLETLVLLALMSGSVVAADFKGWKCIAGISATDRISQVHITNLLLSQGVKSIMEGSVIYGISVPLTQIQQASQLLRADARKRGYYVFWFSEKNDAVRVTEDKQLISRSLISSVLKKPEYGSSTALGRFLRSKDISQLTANYPYIISLCVQERQYLATPKTYRTGYVVLIELQKSLRQRGDGYRGSYQVYDGGNQVAFLGSTEWKAGEK